jgi:hypothetical protein
MFILINMSSCLWFWLLLILSILICLHIAERLMSASAHQTDSSIACTVSERAHSYQGSDGRYFDTLRLLHALLFPGPRSHTSQKLIMTDAITDGPHPILGLGMKGKLTEH